MPKSEPTTVAERRRQKRGPTVTKAPRAKVEIDLSKPGARAALAKLYPAPTSATMLDATPELEAAALRYVDARDKETVAKSAKETAGNVLCNAIGTALGVAGDGWTAVWDTKKGSIDWDAVVKEAKIPAELIEKHRRPNVRMLDIRETAKDEG